MASTLEVEYSQIETILGELYGVRPLAHDLEATVLTIARNHEVELLRERRRGAYLEWLRENWPIAEPEIREMIHGHQKSYSHVIFCHRCPDLTE
jgi:hypothetical protein